MDITQSQIERTEKEYSNYAGETVTVKFIGGAFYVFGSEIACLRIYYKNRYNKTARVEYSENLKTWYYSHETNF